MADYIPSEVRGQEGVKSKNKKWMTREDQRGLNCERPSNADLSLTRVGYVLFVDGADLGGMNRRDADRFAVQRQEFDLVSPGAFEDTHNRSHITGIQAFFWNIGR